MQNVNTHGIVLSRTDYNEADRIITFLTPDHGKVTVLAKGVRKQKSKLAGGIELFSVSEITYLVGRGEVHTLISTRLVKHYGQIVKNIGRTNVGYDFIKIINKATEDHPESAYFNLLTEGFESLDDDTINLELVEVWFKAQLLRLAGHSPNLSSDEQGYKLLANETYLFNFDTMGFHKNGQHDDSFNANSIKFMRLIFSDNSPKTLQKIGAVEKLAFQAKPLINSMMQTYVRV